MVEKHVLIDDIIKNQAERMLNLRRFYPFFVLFETGLSQYADGAYAGIDLAYVTLAVLRYLINENNFNEKDVEYSEIESFIETLLVRDFDVIFVNEEEKKKLIRYLFDKIQNDGKPFDFSFFDPAEKKKKIYRVRLVESSVKEQKVIYRITEDGIEFYLSTKEAHDENRINVEQLLLEKMIRAENFKGGIDVVQRINLEVVRLEEQKNEIVRILTADIFEGIQAVNRYMERIGRWFEEERKSFARNKSLVDKAVGRLAEGNDIKGLREIQQLDTELKKAIENHSALIASTAELNRLAETLLERSKQRGLKSVFDFSDYLAKSIREDDPSLLSQIIMPLMLPRRRKTFSITTIDHLALERAGGDLQGEKVEKMIEDTSFEYEDEKRTKSIGRNYAMMWKELLERLERWGRLSVKELAAMLEVKFGEEIYYNRDFYSFLVSLSKKQHYSMREMEKEQETFLEEMAIRNLSEEERKTYGALSFSVEYGTEEICLKGDEMMITDMTFIKDE